MTLPESAAAVSFGRRLAALIVDCVLSVGVAALFSRPDPPGLLSAAVFFVAYTFFIGLFAQSPGMRLVGLRCVSASEGDRIGLPRAALRAALLQLVVPAVFTDSRGRAWHDRAADSVVLRVSSES